tara:strand:+ start:320 stop:1516 length:1197 start_codon:yes stop_codon:yes gene_type:complete
MKEIQCPKCKELFRLEDSGYADIIKQIKDDEFNLELDKNKEIVIKEKKAAIELEKQKSKNSLNDIIRERDNLLNKVKNIDTKHKLEIQTKLIEKDKLHNGVLDKYKEDISELESDLKISKSDNEITIKTYRKQIEDLDGRLEAARDFKVKQNIKLLGEDLEQHCENEFNKIRSLFPNSVFEKDNDISSGSKGDYVFREKDNENNELVSIMFDMKNESIASDNKNKKKNEDFLKKLDKDRNEKNCEYAILVSMLELENDLYNNGIVDKSYLYPKMYVIRPQFFIPIITIIRNESFKSLEYKSEINLMKLQSLDISNFESNLFNFQKTFTLNKDRFHKKFDDAIKGIDKAISDLEKTKEALMGADKNLRIADKKLQDLSIKKLTKDNPTMISKFEELKNS